MFGRAWSWSKLFAKLPADKNGGIRFSDAGIISLIVFPWLTILRPIEFSIKLQGWSIHCVYWLNEESHNNFPNKNLHVLVSLKINFVLAYSAVPDEMPHYVAFHLSLYTVCQSTHLGVSFTQRCLWTNWEISSLSWRSASDATLKGTATLIISMFYQKELYEPWILIQVSSKSVENGKVMGI